jgi:hypothetical protein
VDVWVPELDGEPTPPRPRQLSPLEQTLLANQTAIWLQEGVVEPAPRIVWTNNPVFVAKSNGTTRVCIDCRPANAVTRDFRWPLLRLQDLRHRVKGMTWFSRIDLRNAFFRISIPEEWRHLTAFQSKGRRFQFRKMPFGLKTAPAVFQRFMDHILSPLSDICVWYMDDILVFATSSASLQKRTQAVQQRLRANGCQINEEKSEYGTRGLLFGGIWVSPRGTGPNLAKVQEALAIPCPRTKKDKQSAIGLVSYLRDFIPLLSLLTADITGGTVDQEELGQKWKGLMRHVAKAITTLANWDDAGDADLFTDASASGVAAVLIQNGRIVAVSSRKLQGAETRYSTTDREHLSLLLAAKKFRIFLHRAKGTTRVWNDHAALMTRRTEDLTPRQARWYTIINQWMPHVHHVQGVKNPADFFSRWTAEVLGGQICV